MIFSIGKYINEFIPFDFPTHYLNYLFNIKSTGIFHSFADDKVIAYIAHCKELVKINWFENNILTINFAKTKYLPVIYYSSSLPTTRILNLADTLKYLESKNIKYLAVVINT